MIDDIDVQPLGVAVPRGHDLRPLPPDYEDWKRRLSDQGVFSMSCGCGLLFASPDLVGIAQRWQQHIHHVVSLQEEETL